MVNVRFSAPVQTLACGAIFHGSITPAPLGLESHHSGSHRPVQQYLIPSMTVNFDL